MNIAIGINPVIDQLEYVLENEVIPAPFDRWGARLLSHLNKPVRVAVTGLKGSGKSALIEMISVQPVLGHKLDLPVTELVYGDSARVLFEKHDGSVIVEGGLLKDCVCPEGAILARQELPDMNLRNQNFIEVGLRGSPEQMRTALDMVVARGDVIIWCSEQFSQEEQRLWAEVPDRIKDHSFLVLTKADHQLMRSQLSDNIARLEQIVAEEFMGLFPVATLQGIVAQRSGGKLQSELWRSSGGEQLMEPLRKQINLGRNADIDQAVVFLDRLVQRSPKRDVEVAAREEDSPPIPASETDQDARAFLADANEKIVLVQDAVGDLADQDLFSDAVELLQRQAVQMLDDLDQRGEMDADRVLSDCTDVMTSLADLLNSAQTDDPAIRELCEDVQEGEEMLMLFRLESGDEAALDAATLLLQIRKELTEKMAV